MSKFFNIKVKKGHPCKSFIFILELDYYLRLAMSILSNTNFFDSYITSYLSWKYKLKDREKMLDDYFGYMTTYNVERVNFLILSKVITRTHLIKIINSISNSVLKIKRMPVVKSDDDLRYLHRASLLWGDSYNIIMDNFTQILNSVRNLQSYIVEHYSSFIIKGLMLRRKGEKNSNKLISDAYYTIMDMIDSYNPVRSKVPFHNLLTFYVKNMKNQVIKRECWDLPDGHVQSLEDFKEEERDDLMNIIKANRSALTNDTYVFLDQVLTMLPNSFKEVLALKYTLIDPLDRHSEIALITK